MKKDKKDESVERDFSVDVKINRFKLDEENEVQPSHYHYWSELYAEAKAEKDDCEDALDLIMAQVEEKIRKAAEKKSEKITESGVKSKIERDEEVINAKDDLRKAKKAVYTLEAATKTLEHRKSSLDNLTTLFTKNYYSQPAGVPPPSNDDAIANDVRKSMNKKKGKK